MVAAALGGVASPWLWLSAAVYACLLTALRLVRPATGGA